MESTSMLRAFAQLAEQTERYEDMVHFSRELIKNTSELHENDRKLFSTAYKCKISQRRTAWRAVSTYLLKETNPLNRPIIAQYKDNLEKEIREICGEVIHIVTDHLGRKSEKNIGEKDKEREKVEIRSKLEFYKMKGDYLRMKTLKEDCEKAYKTAIKLMENPNIKDSLKTDAIKLGICLNLAVFYYEINSSLQEAIETCEKGFNEALESVSDLEDTRFTDVVTIMQLMHDNITAWKLEQERNVK